MTPFPMDVEYRYTAAQNNGQISQQKDWISGEEISYQYDSLSRLITAATTGPEWGLSFAYDGFGNRTNQTVTKGSGPSSALTYNTLNRINGFNYDNNGNITWMTSGVTLTYDVENRSTTMQGGFGTERYGYDPKNQRVYRKKADGTEEFTLWGAGAERIETFRIVSGAAQTQTTNIYFAGRLMRTKDHTTGNETALVTNRVGSVAVRVNPSGINEKLRYYPYGEEYTATANDRDKFATYYRDSSTGLDYAINRYYGNSIGRFLTPDPFGGSAQLARPNSWNRYAYVENDPIRNNDPTGLFLPGNYSPFEAPPDLGGGGGGGKDGPLLNFPPPGDDSGGGGVPPAKPSDYSCGVNPVSGKPGVLGFPDGDTSDLRPGEGGDGRFRRRTGGKHEGIDITAPVGTSLHANRDGVVVRNEFVRGYGNVVVIKHSSNAYTVYAHLDSTSSWLSVGSGVEMGDVIGKAGRTGIRFSQLRSEDHVHFMFKSSEPTLTQGEQYDDPVKYLNSPCP